MFKHFLLATMIMFSSFCYGDSPTVKDYQNNEANGVYDLYLYGLGLLKPMREEEQLL